MFGSLNKVLLTAVLPFKPYSLSPLLVVILEHLSDSDLEAYLCLKISSGLLSVSSN